MDRQDSGNGIQESTHGLPDSLHNTSVLHDGISNLVQTPNQCFHPQKRRPRASKYGFLLKEVKAFSTPRVVLGHLVLRAPPQGWFLGSTQIVFEIVFSCGGVHEFVLEIVFSCGGVHEKLFQKSLAF